MIYFQWQTALMCLLGWLLHWLWEWGVNWKLQKTSLYDYIDSDPPAFWFSILATAICYMIGPSGFSALGITLPAATPESVPALLGALVGYSADSIVYKIANTIPRGK